MMGGMTAVNHIAGKSGQIIDLLARLSDDELREQREYFAQERQRMLDKESNFGAHKWSNMEAAVSREQEFRAQRSKPVE